MDVRSGGLDFLLLQIRLKRNQNHLIPSAAEFYRSPIQIGFLSSPVTVIHHNRPSGQDCFLFDYSICSRTIVNLGRIAGVNIRLEAVSSYLDCLSVVEIVVHLLRDHSRIGHVVVELCYVVRVG